MDESSAGPIIDGSLLAAFAAFAETRSFTHGAKRVGLSQPAFFERIQRLQTQLGARLYKRAGRGLLLTEAGTLLAAHAREVMARGASLLRALRGEPPEETVALAAGEGSYLFLLGEALRRFGAERAGRLRLLTLGARAACEAVLRGEAHLAVCALDIAPARLAAEELLRTPLCLAMAAGHRLAGRRTIALRDLAAERLILAPAGQLHREFVGRALSRLPPGIEQEEPLEADGWPLMLRFAQLGLGVAFVNGICALPEGLVSRPIPEMGLVSYRLISRRGALAEGARRLAALIRETAAAKGAPARRR